jgi:hypothetical protein
LTSADCFGLICVRFAGQLDLVQTRMTAALTVFDFGRETQNVAFRPKW